MRKFYLIALVCYSNLFAQVKKNDCVNAFDYDLAFKSTNHVSKNYIGLDFPSVNILDIDGKKFDSKNSKRLVFYNFWHKGCTPCITEIDMLNQLQTLFKNEVDFIGITFNSKEEITKFREIYGFDFRQISIKEEVLTNLFLYNGYPSSFLVFDGKIIAFAEGGFSDNKSIYFQARMYNSYSKFRKEIENKLKDY